jgi:hypothetical protein
MTYFKESEFACRCRKCDVKVSPLLLKKLNELRAQFGKPLYVNSGVRCPERNAKVGGQSDSEHLTGEGVDLSCETSQDRYLLVKLALDLFPRVGVDARFVHLGISASHPQGVLWLYPPKKATGSASGSAPRS